MNEEEYKKIRNILAKKIKEEEKNIETYNYKNDMASVFNFKSKIYNIVLTSFLPYILLIGTTLMLSICIPSLFSSISAELVSFFLMGSSLAIGSMFENLYEKAHCFKKKTKEDSSLNNQKKLLEEETFNIITLEKAKNKKMALKQAYIMLNTNKYMIDKVRSKYIVTDRKYDEKEINNDIEQLTKSMDCMYNELDVLSTKHMLLSKFVSNSVKSNFIVDTAVNSILGGVLALMTWNLPRIALGNSLTYSSNLPLFILPFVIGAGAVTSYSIKENLDCVSVFNKFNGELENDKLIAKTKDDFLLEEEKIKAKIKECIEKVGCTEYKLQEKKVMLETYNDTYDKEKNDKFISSDKNYSDKVSLMTDDYINYIYNDIEKNIVEKDSPKVMKKVKIVNNNGV